MATGAGVAGQLAGRRRPKKVLLSSSTAIGSPLNVSGMLVKAMFRPTPAGSARGPHGDVGRRPERGGGSWRVQINIVPFLLDSHQGTALGSGPPQEFLMTMPSMMLATVSVASMAASRRSKMSFHRITTIGSMPPLNSEATASRVIRSPSFSRRLISTV
jgi:hypothetical protein